jgi:hypothetical protein
MKMEQETVKKKKMRKHGEKGRGERKDKVIVK